MLLREGFRLGTIDVLAPLESQRGGAVPCEAAVLDEGLLVVLAPQLEGSVDAAGAALAARVFSHVHAVDEAAACFGDHVLGVGDFPEDKVLVVGVDDELARGGAGIDHPKVEAPAHDGAVDE